MRDRLLFLCTKPDNNQHCVVKFLRNLTKLHFNGHFPTLNLAV